MSVFLVLHWKEKDEAAFAWLTGRPRPGQRGSCLGAIGKVTKMFYMATAIQCEAVTRVRQHSLRKCRASESQGVCLSMKRYPLCQSTGKQTAGLSPSGGVPELPRHYRLARSVQKPLFSYLRGSHWPCLRQFEHYNEIVTVIDYTTFIKNILKIVLGRKKCQLMDVEEMLEIEKSRFATTIVMIQARISGC